MHADELAIDASLVETLLAEQFPQFADRTLRPVRSTGTVNAIYRLGDDLCVRLPRLARWATDLEREWQWLPRLAGRTTLEIPSPVLLGSPTDRFPCAWTILRWIEGEPYADHRVAGGAAAARAGHDLARFVTELRRVDLAEAPPAGRRPLRELDVETRSAITAGAGVIDADAALQAWGRALEAPGWDGVRVWIHGDLLRPNLLVRDGRLSAVIDFGGAGVGDPAMDVIAAWSVFGPSGRRRFRETLAVDDGTWERARGVALHQAAMIVPYYRDSNPAFVASAVRTIEQILGAT
ncbi:MAG: aminoglycoside phosphotransferase family protein [Propionibacteriaceae bacterium]